MALLALAGVELATLAKASGGGLGSLSTKWAFALGLYALAAGLLAVPGLALLVRPETVVDDFLDRVERVLPRAGALRWCLVAAGVALPSLILLGPWGARLTGVWPRTLLALSAGVAVGLVLPQTVGKRTLRLALGLLLVAAFFAVAKRLVLVTDYPFKLGWSEGNRLWDYSLYFARDRYEFASGFRYPSYLTPGRHGLWGLAFLIPGAGIALLRFWDAVLWTVPYLLLGLALFSRRRVSLSPWVRWGFALWVFLFLAQGPIYAPLILSAVVVAWGYDRAHPWRSLALVALACFYAGISRWTWLLAPALWAALWALLDEPGARAWWRRLMWPAAVGVSGLVGALGSQAFMDLAFPRPAPVYSTALSQDLLWYRLLPNPTFPMGVLPALALAVGPLLGLLALAHLRGILRWDWLKRAAVAAVLSAFLAAGLVASVKIGGGSNLHNLDMFLVNLVFLAAWVVWEVAGSGAWRRALSQPQVQGLLALALVIPVWWVMRSGKPLKLPQPGVVKSSLQQVRETIEAAASKGEVLFIDQRQLLTFGQVRVPLVMGYELKALTNWAMIGDAELFGSFYQDLRDHRFAMIVTGHLPTEFRGRGHPFGEEDDAQVELIYLPLLKYYEPIYRNEGVGIWLLAPRGAREAGPSGPGVTGE